MQITDLVTIGKLGKLIDENGFIPFKPGKAFHQDLLKDIFLVFRNNSVRYVTVEKIINSYRIKIDDEETARHAADEGNVKVMLPKNEIEFINKDLIIDEHIGKKIIFDSNPIGEVIEIFDNSAYELITCKLYNGKEIMIPFIDQFIQEYDDNKITVINIEGLLEL